jgi:hypothetical protein
MKSAVIGLLLGSAVATVGVDLSTLGSTSNYSCMKSNGMSFVIPRAWCSYGGADSNGPTNVKNARAAGIPYVDIYMFPCRGKSASDQVNSLISYMANNGVTEEAPMENFPSAKGMSAGNIFYNDDEIHE